MFSQSVLRIIRPYPTPLNSADYQKNIQAATAAGMATTGLVFTDTVPVGVPVPELPPAAPPPEVDPAPEEVEPEPEEDELPLTC